ncbi:hypothetical protein F4819DRAFT_478213 [Hypoxylon fuscum]|nr:hypothetical protein F4819DRAFT_478213 [Hypoxylon fuscum]
MEKGMCGTEGIVMGGVAIGTAIGAGTVVSGTVVGVGATVGPGTVTTIGVAMGIEIGTGAGLSLLNSAMRISIAVRILIRSSKEIWIVSVVVRV